LKRLLYVFNPKAAPIHPTNECQNCKNDSNSPTITIENAQIIDSDEPGNAPSGPTPNFSIKASYNATGPSDQTLLAIEKEKTRQLEIATAAELQKEHDRNKWLATLIEYNDEKQKEHQEDLYAKLSLTLQQLLQTHHSFQEQLEQKRNAAQLEKERLRN